MKSIGSRFLAAISVLLASAAGLFASTNPRYGGTLRIELQASKISFDPRQWKDGSPDSARDEKLAALVFDRLISLDNYGRFQPQLAVEWSHGCSPISRVSYYLASLHLQSKKPPSHLACLAMLSNDA